MHFPQKKARMLILHSEHSSMSNLTKPAPLTLKPQDAYRLFKVSTELADTLENILETHGAYSSEFVRGLTLSFKQADSGKLKKVRSIKGVR